ncbi:MAG TPA: hypothetical protein PKA05_04175 [Roseiflexaceae bacterium]|nr:hypothetical protein [Roseiflexaceae bacterium]HMP39556.1 hypothetical protein [Roseiflexaceae bacterium]
MKKHEQAHESPQPSNEQIPQSLGRYMLVLERPSSAELSALNRADRYRALFRNSEELRRRLLRWIDEQHLDAEIPAIDEPTTFNMLFAVATPRGAECLEQAPGVISISPTGEVAVSLMARKQGLSS